MTKLEFLQLMENAMTRTPNDQTPHEVADAWENWCGVTKWSTSLREFGDLGGKILWWCGMPRSTSAIPLTFALYTPTGEKLYCDYRLKDIRAAIVTLNVPTSSDTLTPAPP